jgi:hypothetical protein
MRRVVGTSSLASLAQAITQSVMQGMTLPSRQSIEALKTSSLFWIEKLMKFVSSRMR